jgi:hypothetical protein
MGTWGVNLYDNDTASDARDEWVGKLKQGASPKEATNEVLELLRGWDDPVAWIALADTQWTWGRLDARVLREAKRALAAGGDLELWTKPKDRATRQRVFNQVAARLTKKAPAPKAFKPDGDAVDWKVGQLWGYRTLDDKWVVFRVTAIDPKYALVPSPMFELLDVVLDGGDKPPVVDLSSVGLRAARKGYDGDPAYASLAPEHRRSPMFQAAVKVRGERPRSRLRRIRAVGTPRPATAATQAIGVPWFAMDDFLANIYDVGGPRPGAIVRWPLPEGGAGYAMIEFGHWDDTTPWPKWQVSLLDCRGNDVNAKTLKAARVTARLIVYGFPPEGGLREVGHRQIRDIDNISGVVYEWKDIPRKLAEPPEGSVGSEDVMKAFMAMVEKRTAERKAGAAKAKPRTKTE